MVPGDSSAKPDPVAYALGYLAIFGLLCGFAFSQAQFLKNCSVETGTDSPDVISAHAGGKDKSVWADGDVLSFAWHTANDVSINFCGLPLPMTTVDRSGWKELRLRIPGLDEGRIPYFMVDPLGSSPPQSEWVGPKAPPLPVMAKTLIGKLETTDLQSSNLNEARKVTVYIPPGAGLNLPVVYMTDGQSTEDFARVLEPLILGHKVRPIAIVGVYSGVYKGDRGNYDQSKDVRAQEYLYGINKAVFDRHVKFFNEEVEAWAVKKYGLSTARKDKALYGFSNGGAFAALDGVRHSDLFGNVFPCSIAGSLPKTVPTADLPEFRIGVGKLDPFWDANTTAVAQLMAAGAQTTFTTYVAGHDMSVWEIQFAKDLCEAFPPASS